MIDNGLLLTPRELYCLGGILNAKYIDYAYIAALDDIGQDFELFKKETLASLVSKGILMEDFSGNMELDENFAQLLLPIFFGNIETSLNICTIGEELKVDIYNFHFHNGNVTLVKNHENVLLLCKVDSKYMLSIIKDLLPGNYSSESNNTITNFDKSKVSRFFSAKGIDIGKASRVKTFIEYDNILCTEADQTRLISLSAEDFIKGVFDIIKGAM